MSVVLKFFVRKNKAHYGTIFVQKSHHARNHIRRRAPLYPVMHSMLALPHTRTHSDEQFAFYDRVMNEVQKRACERDLFQIECAV